MFAWPRTWDNASAWRSRMRSSTRRRRRRLPFEIGCSPSCHTICQSARCRESGSPSAGSEDRRGSRQERAPQTGRHHRPHSGLDATPGERSRRYGGPAGRKLAVEPQPLVVAEILEEASRGQELIAAAKGVKLTTHSVAADVRVMADRERLLQVIANLLGNAIKFTDPAVRCHCERALGMSTSPSPSMTVGPGFRPNILTGFSIRISRSSGRSSEGRGLGSTSAKALCSVTGAVSTWRARSARVNLHDYARALEGLTCASMTTVGPCSWSKTTGLAADAV